MGIKFVKAKDRTWFEMDKGVQICRDVSSDVSSTMGFSIGEFENCRMDWTVLYDEYLYCVEGTITLETDEGDFVLERGDGIWLPDGTHVIYKAEEKSTCIAAIYPANWREIHGYEV